MKNKNTSKPKGRMKLLATLIASATLLVACDTSSKFHSASNPDFDLRSVETFAVEPIAPKESDYGAHIANTFKYGRIVENEISQNLKAAGYSEVPLGEADVVFRVMTDYSHNTEVVDWGPESYSMYYRRGAYWVYDYGHSIDIRTYESATITIESQLSESGEPIWVGWSTVRMPKKEPSAEMVTSFIQRIISPYPER